MRRVVGIVAGCAALWACTPSKPGRESPSAKSASPERSAIPSPAPSPSPAPAQAPPSPPSLTLEVLEERGARGLAIQNRTATEQTLAATVHLRGEGQSFELPLGPEPDCLRLAPGGELVWPADWGATLAPDQSALAKLRGTYHFEARGCQGGEPLRSSEFSLPVR